MTTGTGTKHVFFKELREMARDRRVVQASIVMPIFMVALFVMIMGVVQNSVTGSKASHVAIVGDPADKFLDKLQDSPLFVITPVATWESGIRQLKDKEVDLVVDIPPAEEGKTDRPVRLGYNDQEPLSAIELGKWKAIFGEANRAQVRATLEQHKLDPGLAEPFKIQEVNFAKDQGLAGSSIVSLLPYLIVLWAFYGGMSVVADLVAGEKERGTMETLLVSPVRRAAVALGKILALMVVCFIGSLTTLAGVFLAGTVKTPISAGLFPSGLQIGIGQVALAALTLVTLVAFFASLMVSLAARARNIREAQTYLGLMSFMIIMPAVFSQIIGFTGMEHAAWVNWVPVLNTAVLLKAVILGTAVPAQYWPVWLVNLLLAAVFLRVSIQLFRREEIVLRV